MVEDVSNLENYSNWVREVQDQTGFGCELLILINCAMILRWEHKMVHLVGVGGREFSVDGLAGCRCPFTESTLNALDHRVLGGRIGRLSLPLHRVDAECSGSTNL